MTNEEKPLSELEQFAAQVANNDQMLAASRGLAAALSEFFKGLLLTDMGLMNRQEALALTVRFLELTFEMSKR